MWVVAGLPEKPMRWQNAQGGLEGFDVELLDAVMKRLGVAYRIELVDSSERLLRNVKAQPSGYDMLLAYSYTPEREALFVYPKESHLRLHWNFFVLREQEHKFRFENFQDLKGAMIGVTKGMSYTPEFWSAVQTVPLQVDEVMTNKVQLDKLLAGRFDLVPLNTKAALWEAREKGVQERIAYLSRKLKDQDYFNVFARNSSHPERARIQARYDEILRQMKRDGSLRKLQLRYGLE